MRPADAGDATVLMLLIQHAFAQRAGSDRERMFVKILETPEWRAVSRSRRETRAIRSCSALRRAPKAAACRSRMEFSIGNRESIREMFGAAGKRTVADSGGLATRRKKE